MEKHPFLCGEGVFLFWALGFGWGLGLSVGRLGAMDFLAFLWI
jgi:hypothetical protein